MRIDNCHRKERELIRKQELIKERIGKFERFVAENNAKKQRALAKFQLEQRHKERKIKELEELDKEFETLTIRLLVLKRRVMSLSKHQRFMEKALQLLPEDRSLVGDGSISALILQHETLRAANDTLTEKLNEGTNEIEERQQRLQKLTADHANEILVNGKKLAAAQKRLDQLINRNARLEEKTLDDRLLSRKEGEIIGRVKLAIENIADKCGFDFSTDSSHSSSSYSQKLAAISRFILERQEVLSLACTDHNPRLHSAKSRSSK